MKRLALSLLVQVFIISLFAQVAVTNSLTDEDSGVSKYILGILKTSVGQAILVDNEVKVQEVYSSTGFIAKSYVGDEESNLFNALRLDISPVD